MEATPSLRLIGTAQRGDASLATTFDGKFFKKGSGGDHNPANIAVQPAPAAPLRGRAKEVCSVERGSIISGMIRITNQLTVYLLKRSTQETKREYQHQNATMGERSRATEFAHVGSQVKPSQASTPASIDQGTDARRWVRDENSVAGVQLVHELGFVPLHSRAGRCYPPCP